MNFRGGADEGEAFQLQDEHIGGGVYVAESAVEIDGGLVEGDGEALAGDELEDVAGLDEFLAVADHPLVFRLGGVGLGGLLGDLREAVEGGDVEGAVEDLDDGGDAAFRGGVGFLRGVVLVEKRVCDNLDAAEAVVEDEEGVREHEEGVGDAEGVFGRLAEGWLELADRIVGKVADHAAGEGWEGWVCDGFEGCHFPLEGGEDVVGGGEGAGFAALGDGDFLPHGGEDALGAGADDGPAPAFVGGFGGLEEEGMLRIAELDVGGEGRLEIRGELGENGDDVSFFREGFEGGKGWLYWDGAHGREDGVKL